MGQDVSDKCDGPQNVCGKLRALMAQCYGDKWGRGVTQLHFEATSEPRPMGVGVGVQLAQGGAVLLRLLSHLWRGC